MALIWTPNNSAAGQELFIPAVGRDPVRGLVVEDTSDGAGFAVTPTYFLAGAVNMVAGQGRWILFNVGSRTRISRAQWYRTTLGAQWAAGIFDVDFVAGLVNPVSVSEQLNYGDANTFVTVDLPEVVLDPAITYAWSIFNPLESAVDLGMGTISSSGGSLLRIFSRSGMNYNDWNEPQFYPGAVTVQTAGPFGRGWFA